MYLAFDELIDFIAGGTTREQVAAFKPSDAARQRAVDLLARLKADSITPDESAELDDYLWLENFMRLVKARASVHLNEEGNSKP